MAMTENNTPTENMSASDSPCTQEGAETHWYAMRDLKRPNAREPAYKMLEAKGMEVYTPMTKRPVIKGGRKTFADAPFIPDLLFVYSGRDALDAIVDRTPTLQYRYMRGGKYREPMTVRDADMRRFMAIAHGSSRFRFYAAGEVSPAMYGRRIAIVGGDLDGYEGRLMTVRGSRVRRLIVELEGLLAVGVEVQPEYIRLIGEQRR